MASGISFHNTIDNARMYQVYTGVDWQDYPLYITFRNRSVSYQFFPHFHPYVPALIARLNDGGFPELQDSDTLYLPQPNPPLGQPLQPLTAIAGSTKAMLLANVTGTRPNGGPSIGLSAGTPLTLPAGTTINVANGTTVGHTDGSTGPLAAATAITLPGFLPVAFSSGIQNANTAAAIIVPDSTTVTMTLPAGASAVLTNDGSQVTLPAATSISVRSGEPQPFFYVDDFVAQYSPNSNSVDQPYPVKNIDFTYNGAYSIYNWELFFHVPLLIAIHLSQNQKFQDAQNWFHYIFDPTDNSPGPTPERFWKVEPFQYTDVRLIEDILVNLAHEAGRAALRRDRQQHQRLDDSTRSSLGPSPSSGPRPTCSRP